MTGWEEVVDELAKIEAKGEHAILIGDINKHVGDLIEENVNDKMTYGGSLIKDLIESNKYILVNIEYTVGLIKKQQFKLQQLFIT